MHRLLKALGLPALGAAAWGSANAGIIFTPHLSEYAVLPAGTYTETTLIATHIKHIYDEDGNKVPIGEPFVPRGASTDAALALFKLLWIGNVFRDTKLPYLNSHSQFCRVIGGFGYQQNTKQIADRGRLFGINAGANGLTDLFGLCGIYGSEHRLGPLSFNGLFATTLKLPTGAYETNNALNIGTNYRTVIPQLALHADLYGKMIFDGTAAYQFNGKSKGTSFGGLTPSQPANVYNLEGNLAWKFTEHWYADVGFSFRKSDGPNTYEGVDLNFKDQPIAPDSACAQLGVSRANCDSPLLDQFYLEPRSGPYSDKGTMGQIVTAGVYYVYRTSSVLQLRFAQPIKGRGGEIAVTYDVCAVSNCPGADNNGNGTGDNSISQLQAPLFGVQEAAAVSASPYLEARFVYLFWAP